MKKTYALKVNDTHTFDLNTQDANALDSIETTSKEQHILYKNTSYTTSLVSSDFHQKKYAVTVNGTTYDVAIADDLDILIKTLGLSLGSTKVVNSIKAPMPGLILSVNAQIGQEIKEGDSLIIIEAMKMENNLTSPRDGVIKDITIKAGDTVEKNALLIEFE
ncbi:acyl-CoA carboxylase biotin carboxyl carrier protein subunit [Aquimarina rhabdastrellae]